jgi:hypothetical protein
MPIHARGYTTGVVYNAARLAQPDVWHIVDGKAPIGQAARGRRIVVLASLPTEKYSEFLKG